MLVNMDPANAAFRREVALRNSQQYGMNYSLDIDGGMVRGGPRDPFTGMDLWEAKVIFKSDLYISQII